MSLRLSRLLQSISCFLPTNYFVVTSTILTARCAPAVLVFPIPFPSTSCPARGTKRKFDFDASAVETLAREAEEAALRQIEREQADALKSKLPDFWLPSLTPTYTSAGPPASLADVKLQTTCHGGNPAHPFACVSLSPASFVAAVFAIIFGARRVAMRG